MTKSTLLKLYSIVKVVRAKELPLLSKVYKDNPERLLVMFKKRPETPDDVMPSWFKKWNKTIFIPVLNELTKINKRLDRIETIIEANNLIDPIAKPNSARR